MLPPLPAFSSRPSDLFLSLHSPNPFLKWKKVGPANQNHFGQLTGFGDDLSALPPTIGSFVKFLKSAKFIRFLRQLTELPLIGLAGSVRRFRHGDYTLLHDTDQIMSEATLDVNFFCTRSAFSTSTGGYTCYMAEGEDEELLTVEPKSNTLTLVYREPHTMRFVKYLNCTAEGSFFDFFGIYREDPGIELEVAEDEEDEGGEEGGVAPMEREEDGEEGEED